MSDGESKPPIIIPRKTGRIPGLLELNEYLCTHYGVAVSFIVDNDIQGALYLKGLQLQHAHIDKASDKIVLGIGDPIDYTKPPAPTGPTGWIAYNDAYPLHVEFLGANSYVPDYPGEQEHFYRVFTDMHESNWQYIYAGDIVSDDEQKMYTTKEEALAAIRSHKVVLIAQAEAKIAADKKRLGL